MLAGRPPAAIGRGTRDPGLPAPRDPGRFDDGLGILKPLPDERDPSPDDPPPVFDGRDPNPDDPPVYAMPP